MCLFLITCGGGDGSVPFDQQTDASNPISNSNNDDSSNNISTSQSSPDFVKENRFGKCVFGECKFE